MNREERHYNFRSNQIEPYQQGHLDNLCGLYALINASCLADRSISHDECIDVFFEAIIWLNGKYKNCLAKGLDYSCLCSLHTNIFQKQWPTISLHRPFWKNKPRNPKEYWSRMKEEASRPDQGMFIGIGGEMDHWSVVRKITDTRIYLFDSYGRHYLPHRLSGPSLTDDPLYPIGPNYVLLLRKRSQK